MMADASGTAKPRQGFAGLWNISFGFFGIQIGFALQNANMSRIFQSLGQSLDDLPVLWVAAPLTGLLVQPIIGHYSDRTWNRFGRRRPYFFAGAILATLALFIMPNTPGLWFAVATLWLLDASLNISMEPFRAFVADMLGKDQHTAGYAFQTAFIGAGAVVGSATPWLLDMLGVSNAHPGGGIPDTVRYGFYIGGTALLTSVLWTIFTTREYDPETLAAYNGTTAHAAEAPPVPPAQMRAILPWIAAGTAVILAVEQLALEKELYLLGGLLCAFGLARLGAAILTARGHKDNLLTHIVGDFAGMPDTMKRLALVQFFSWSALFIMWIYTTPVVAQYMFGSSDPASQAFNRGGNWVGILFAAYNAVAALFAAFLLPGIAARFGKRNTHILCLLIGAAGFAAFLVIRDPNLLLVAEIGIGIAWASILAMPYAILAAAVPQDKLGVYMGLFNIFVVVPQLLVATVMGSLLKALFPTEPIWTMATAALVLILAAGAMLRVADDRIERPA